MDKTRRAVLAEARFSARTVASLLPLAVALGCGPSASKASDVGISPTGSGGGQSVVFSGTGGSSGDFSVGTGTDDEPNGGIVTPGCQTNCTDLPSAPIMDATGPTPVPANASTLFGDPDTFDATKGPCVAEPGLAIGSAPGALFPSNWLRPRFRYIPASGENLFEIRISAPSEANPLVAYTTATTWAIPRDVWKNLGANAVDQPITVTIRGVNSASPGMPTGTRGTFTIAPVLAGGTMIYWAASSSDVNPMTSKLQGFRVGDESAIDALTIPDVQETGIIQEDGNSLRGTYTMTYGVPPGHVECIGCHVSTPDGNSVGFTDQWPWEVVEASVEQNSVGAVPGYLTAGAQRLIGQPWLGMQTYSKAHFTTGDRVLISSYAVRQVSDMSSVGFASSDMQNGDKLAWFDLETTASIPWQMNQVSQMNDAIQQAFGSAWGFVTLTGETRVALTPNFSHDGTKIAYTSATSSQDGRIGDNSETDIHIVPFSNRQGGTVTPLAGASTTGVAEYYPAFSADDTLIAFNHVGTATATQGKIYYRPDAEVFVIPSGGGTATRLAANDPPACTGEMSPGIINSWAKWSPSVVGTNGKHYYWLIFSSARKYPGSFTVPANQYSPSDTRSSQLYMTGIVVDDTTSAITTYGAVYLWNQAPTTTNLTPAWDEVNIPPVPPPQ